MAEGSCLRVMGGWRKKPYIPDKGQEKDTTLKSGRDKCLILIAYILSGERHYHPTFADMFSTFHCIGALFNNKWRHQTTPSNTKAHILAKLWTS